MAESLRAIHTKYDNQPLVYKKASGKLSGEDLDGELGPLLKKAEDALKAAKLAVVSDGRTALGNVGGFLGGTLEKFRKDFDRIRNVVPKTSDGTSLDFVTLRNFARDATTLESTMQLEIASQQAAKLTQNATPATPAKSVSTRPDPLKELCKRKNWAEKDCSAIMTDASDEAIKLEVAERIVGADIHKLNRVLQFHKLTLAEVRVFLLDHGVRTITDLNKYLEDFGAAAALDTTLRKIGNDGLAELHKRGVPNAFIAQHAGEPLPTILREYRKTIVAAPQAVRPYDPITDGVNPNKDPLTYSKLEAYLQFLTGDMATKGVNMDFHHTYSSRYEGENGIGAEYWPNGRSNTWVVHVQRGPNGGLKVGSVKEWSERGLLGHSQKLTVDQLTNAGVAAVDNRRTH
jgi:hypothetical protein